MAAASVMKVAKYLPSLSYKESGEEKILHAVARFCS